MHVYKEKLIIFYEEFFFFFSLFLDLLENIFHILPIKKFRDALIWILKICFHIYLFLYLNLLSLNIFHFLSLFLFLCKKKIIPKFLMNIDLMYQKSKNTCKP